MVKSCGCCYSFYNALSVGFNNQEKSKFYASLIPINKTEIKEAPKPKLSHQFSIIALPKI